MKKRRGKRLLAGVMALCMTATGVMTGSAPVAVRAQEASEQDREWEKISGILDSYPGIYTKDTKMGSPWNTEFNPDGPLMGNGTVYAFMAGDQKQQNLYISHSNMWQDFSGKYTSSQYVDGQEYTTYGGITIQLAEDVNLALNKEVKASSYVSEKETPSYMLDGKTNTKWCSTLGANGNSSTYWAVVDLGEVCDISRWVVKHAEAGGETPDYNTMDFKLQYLVPGSVSGADAMAPSAEIVSGGDAFMDAQSVSQYGTAVSGGDVSSSEIRSEIDPFAEENWVDADTVAGNRDAVTDRNLEQPVQARYIRLLVTKPTFSNNNSVRIYELELYEKPTLGEIQPFRYEQDMKNAEITAQSKDGFTTQSWLSAKENLLVTEITNVTEDTVLPVCVSAWTANANTTAVVGADGKTMIATKTGVSKPNPNRPSGTGTWEGWNINIAMASRIIGDVEAAVTNVDPKKNQSMFDLQPGETVTLVSAIEGGKEDGTENTLEAAIEKATAKLNSRLTQEALDTSRQNHREYWKEYWMKSYIDIQDEDIERWYYGNLYQAGCVISSASENNGGATVGIFPWTAVDHPAWQGDFTTNTDFQRPIHPSITANRIEGIENYIQSVEQYWPEAQRRAESVTELNRLIDHKNMTREKFTEGIEGGALFPTHIGPWGASTEQFNNWKDYWYQASDASSTMMPIVKLWKYTMDEDLLNRIYPMMKSVSIFWENYVTLEDGKYVVYGATHEGNAGRNAILDIDACKYMLKNTILAANELGIDKDKVEIWQNILDNMSEVPTFKYNGKTTICDVEGRTQGNKGPTFDGNPVTIQSVYYFDSIGMSSSDEEKEKYINYLETTAEMGSKGKNRRLTSATRLGYDINEIMAAWKATASSPASGDWGGMRGNNASDIGGVSNIGAIQDSLIQSNEGFINIFANWPDNEETSFRRLRTEGAFLVDADQNKVGQVTYSKIHSEKGRECSVLNPWQDQNLSVKVLKNGVEIETTESTNRLGTVYTFPTEAGADYELKPDTNLPMVIAIEGAKDVFYEDTLQLTVKTNADETSIAWKSSDEKIGVVDENGLVTPKKLGEVTITASIQGTEEISDSCTIRIIDQEKLPSNQLNAIADSEENKNNDGPGSNAVDGKEDTYWHSGYSSGKVQPDIPNNKNNSIIIDLGDTYTIGRLDYVPRQSSDNGCITKYEVWYSTEAEGDDNFTKAGEGSWKEDKTTKTADFAPIPCRRLRIRAMETNSGKNKWITAAEFYVYKVLPKEGTIDRIITEIPKVEVTIGTAWEDLSASLPEQVEIELSTGANMEVSVIWNQEGYDPEQAGTCNLTGTLQLPAGISNPSGLTAAIKVRVQETNKEDLRAMIAYAETQKENENYKYVVPKVKKAFETALKTAVAVSADPKAPEGQVLAAYQELLKMTHMLSYTGNSDNLKVLTDAAEGLNQDLYTADSAKRLNEALTTAKDVLANENALQDEIDAAVTALQKAMDQLVLRLDKEALKRKIQEAEAINLDEFLSQGKAEFTNALTKAKDVYAKEDAQADEVKAAYDALQKAIMELREKPDKSKLEALLVSSRQVEASRYTDASAAVFTRALSKAEAVLANPEADQTEVDAAESQLDAAVQQLEKKPDGGDQENPGQGDEDGKDDGNDGKDDGQDSNDTPADGSGTYDGDDDAVISPKTGDNAPVGIIAVALLAGLGISVAALRKKRRR